MKTIPRNILLFGLLFVPLVYRVEAASPDPAAQQDQVVIKATREKVVKLQKEVLLAEQRFYERYNELNTKRDYAVKCYNEAETGSHFKKTYCQPVFANKAQEEEARRLVASIGNSSTPETTSSAASRMHAGASIGAAGMAGGINSGQPSENLPETTSAELGAPAIMAVEGGQPGFQQNMVELTRKHPELVELLNKHAELVKEYEATLRGLKGLDPQAADKATLPATSPR